MIDQSVIKEAGFNLPLFFILNSTFFVLKIRENP
jgi:hypothetical protein